MTIGAPSIDLENFDLEQPDTSMQVPTQPDPVASAVQQGIEAATHATNEQNQAFYQNLLRSTQPAPAPAAPQLPTWDDFTLPDSVTERLPDNMRATFVPVLTDAIREGMRHQTPVYSQALQNTATHASQQGAQNAISYVEGQRIANEHAPTFQRLPEQVRVALAQQFFPQISNIADHAQRWQEVERLTQGIGAAFVAPQQQAPAQGFAGSSVRSTVAPGGSRQPAGAPMTQADTKANDIASFLAANRRT